MVIIKDTPHKHIFIIYDGKKKIGLLSTLKGGALFIDEKEIFGQEDGFGLLKEFLYYKDFEYIWIFFKYKDKIYATTREYLKNNGKEYSLSFGIKVFLSIKKLLVLNPSEPRFSFYFD